VAIELISTHIRRELERRSRHFRQEMAGSLSLGPSLSRGPAREPSIEELGLTVLEQTPQLKVGGVHLVQSDVVFMLRRVYTRFSAIEHQLDKISSSSRIAWQLS
jgi:hypothetical protein